MGTAVRSDARGVNNETPPLVLSLPLRLTRLACLSDTEVIVAIVVQEVE